MFCTGACVVNFTTKLHWSNLSFRPPLLTLIVIHDCRVDLLTYAVWLVNVSHAYMFASQI